MLKFKDDITALDVKKHSLIPKKGIINATVTAKIFQEMAKTHIPTHFVELVEPDVMIVQKLKMIPVEVVCRNIAAGHFIKNFPMFKKGDKLKLPVIEFYLKNDALHDPMLSEDHIIALELASRRDIEQIKRLTLRVNNFLKKFMSERGLVLVDFKLEFGKNSKNQVMLGDELNIDSMRLWDKKTGEAIDKDVYRQGGAEEDVAKTYIESYKRIVGKELK
jgi:phosphoribosylaminoimidazole-succinocarboxamide synthase